MTNSASRTIKSAHRVLEILEYFDEDRRHATVMDMSRTLDYPQSSTSELLRCLTRLGYLHYNRFRRTYSPTTRVALLGAWVNPSLFRGGPVLRAIDEVAQSTGQAVTLSTGANYLVQYLHVTHGSNEAAVNAHCGDTRPMLHSPQGRLLLSSYRVEHVRLAVHRLNAEEPVLERQVKIADVLAEFAILRERGWLVEQEADGTGSVCVLLPRRKNVDRLVVSVQAPSDVVAERGEEFLAMLLRQRDRIAALYIAEDGTEQDMTNVVPMPEPVKIASYRRHFA